NFGAPVNAKAPVFVGEFGSFTLLFTATFGYAAGWNPYAADYTRYLPPNTNRQMVGFWAAMGVFVSCVVIELAGAALATVAGTKYELFWLLISYWIGPWLAVVLTDYWLRKGDYGDESIFYDTKYQRWQGAAAMAIGLVVSVWLFGNNILYTGVIPSANPGIGDITFIVGFVLTGILYYAFNMMSRRAASP